MTCSYVRLKMGGMKYGYARVSTDDQNPALQLAALKKAGCQAVFKDEGLSGDSVKRPALSRCLKARQASDTLNRGVAPNRQRAVFSCLLLYSLAYPEREGAQV